MWLSIAGTFKVNGVDLRKGEASKHENKLRRKASLSGARRQGQNYRQPSQVHSLAWGAKASITEAMLRRTAWRDAPLPKLLKAFAGALSGTTPQPVSDVLNENLIN